MPGGVALRVVDSEIGLECAGVVQHTECERLTRRGRVRIDGGCERPRKTAGRQRAAADGAGVAGPVHPQQRKRIGAGLATGGAAVRHRQGVGAARASGEEERFQVRVRERTGSSQRIEDIHAGSKNGARAGLLETYQENVVGLGDHRVGIGL